VDDDRFKIFSGTANPILAESICRHLDVPLGARPCSAASATAKFISRFWKMFAERTYSFVQPCHAPVDSHLLELLLMIDAFKRASAWRITAVLPVLLLRARRTAKTSREFPFPQSWSRDLLETAGASRALTLDLHAPQIQGYFDVPVDHLYGSPVLVEHFRQIEFAEFDGGFAGCRGR